MTFLVRPGVLRSKLDDVTVLFSRDDRRLHVLNHAAAAVWGLIEAGEASRESMTTNLAEAFSMDVATIGPDIDSALALLAGHGLIDEEAPDRPVSPTTPDRHETEVAVEATGPTFAAINARLALDVDDPELRSRLHRLLEPLRNDSKATEIIGVNDLEIRVGENRPYQVESIDQAVTAVVAEVNASAVRSCRLEPVMHAAAVADGRGAVLLAAPADHGKSTLALALVSAGWNYLTDEAAAIADAGRVRAYPKRIALDEGSFDRFPETDPAVNLSTIEVEGPFRYVLVDGSAPLEPVPVRAVWFPKWIAGAPLSIDRLEPVEALHSLLENSFDFVGDDADAGVAFARLCSLAESIPMARFEFGATADALMVVDSEGAADLAALGVIGSEVDQR